MTFNFVLSALLLSVLSHNAAATCSGQYNYDLKFDFNWSFDTDRGFPNKNPESNPSFSKLVCASHSPAYTMWKPAAILSLNMISFVKPPEPDVRPIERELRDAKTSGTVRELNITETGSGSLGELKSLMKVNSTHHLISCVSRIIPSPGWFIGISSLDMCEGDSFLKTHDLTLYGWWGGLDLADDYNEEKPIGVNDTPFKVRRRIDFAPFGYGTLFMARLAPGETGTGNPEDQDTSPNAAKTNGPGVAPESEAICVDADALRHLPRHALVYPNHRPAYLLCDRFNSCATAGHIVIYHGQPMMMSSYCEIVANCERRVMLVNSPKYSRGLRIDTATENLKFTAFAARFSTRTEESLLSLALRMGL